MNNFEPEEKIPPVNAMRREYTQGGIRRKELSPCPVQQFRLWFDQALKAQILEPNAMALATSDKKNRPSLRTVLLKAYDERGFVFFTNYKSRKAREIEDNPQVSLLFPWLALERQVVICGRIEKISTKESFQYFQSRPKGSQLGAWVSQQSSVITKRALLEAKWEEMKRKFKEGEIPLPDFWGGYRVIPDSVEFWQGRQNRLHDRFLYEKVDGEWLINRLEP